MISGFFPVGGSCHKGSPSPPVPGEGLLTLCAGLWARALSCHQNRKKEITRSYGFEARGREAADFTFLQA